MIYTSCYVKLWEIRDAVPDAVFISIAGYPAPWFKEFSQLEYKKLAPKKAWWQEWHDRFERDLESKESREWYEKKYRETVLDKLNPKETALEIKNMSEWKPVFLMCHEPPGKFCHRHIVQKWFNDMHIACEEWTCK